MKLNNILSTGAQRAFNAWVEKRPTCLVMYT